MGICAISSQWVPVNMRQGTDLLQCVIKVLLMFGRDPEEENLTRIFQQRHDAEEDEHGDEEWANWVRNQPPKLADEDGRDDDPNAAECVSQDVQEDPWERMHRGGKSTISLRMSSIYTHSV